MEQLFFSITDIITMSTVLLGLAGGYWKMRIDIKAIDLKIAEINCDRIERWRRHDEERDKQEAYLDSMMKLIAAVKQDLNELKGDTKSIRTDIQWLKEK